MPKAKGSIVWLRAVGVGCLALGWGSVLWARETQLAGIRLDQRAIEILDIYGVPHEVQVGAAPAAVVVGGPPTAPGALGMPGAPMAPGMPPEVVPGAPMAPGMPSIPGLPGAPPMAGFGGGYAMPGGGPMPGMPPEAIQDQFGPYGPYGPGASPQTSPPMVGPAAPPGAPFEPSAPMMGTEVPPGMPYGPPALTTAAAVPAAPPPAEVRWIYRFQPDLTLEVTIDPDGLVSAISLTGSRCTFARTKEGIQLGMDYRRVLKRYGWPDRTETPSRESIIVYYQETNNIAFAFNKTGTQPYRVTTIVISRPD